MTKAELLDRLSFTVAKDVLRMDRLDLFEPLKMRTKSAVEEALAEIAAWLVVSS
jgi:hypothetical protein